MDEQAVRPPMRQNRCNTFRTDLRIEMEMESGRGALHLAGQAQPFLLQRLRFVIDQLEAFSQLGNFCGQGQCGQADLQRRAFAIQHIHSRLHQFQLALG